MKDVVAIGADHYNTLWLVRSLGMAGLRPTAIIVGVQKGKSFVAKSRYCKDVIFIDDASKIATTLMSLHFEGRVVVIAAGDVYAEHIDASFDCLTEKYILSDCGRRGGGVTYWMDKKRMIENAIRVGLTTPRSQSVGSFDDLLKEEIAYPCLVKPEVSALSSKSNFRVCGNEVELRTALSEVAYDEHRVLVQEYIRADYELLVYGVRTRDGRVILPGGLKKLHTCTSSANLGMMSYGCITSELSEHGIEEAGIIRFVEAIDYHGVFSMEFMIADGKAFFLEMNLRNDGTVYCTTKAGVNIPAIWNLSATGGDIDNTNTRLQREKTFCMNEVNYLKYTFPHQSIIKSINEILKTKAFSLLEIRDMGPVLYKAALPFIKHIGGGKLLEINLLHLLCEAEALNLTEERRLAA